MQQDAIPFVCDYLFKAKGKVACISGGRRPFIFINKILAQKNNKAFYPPKFFTNDDFIENIVFENASYCKLPDIEAAFILYEIIKTKAPELLKESKNFASFLPWAFEILSFIEQLDLEKVSQEKMKNIELNADIGYSVPEKINDLLKNIFTIRAAFHERLKANQQTTKGYSFLTASNMDANILAGDFDEIVLLSPFYLRKTESEIFKKIYSLDKLSVFTRGDPHQYEILKNIYTQFGQTLPPPQKEIAKTDFEVFCGFDDQSQALIVKNLISNLPPEQRQKSVIILANPDLLSCIMSEMSALGGDFNISMGYPAAKTAVLSLLKSILAAQLSKKAGKYYCKDIIKVLTNPLIKNMRFFHTPIVSRVIVHSIEQIFAQNSENILASRLFIDLKDIENNEELIKKASDTVLRAWDYVKADKLKEIIIDMLKLLFVSWEKINTLNDFADALLSFIDKVLNLSIIDSYQLNANACKILIDSAQELKFGESSKTSFLQEDIINIFIKLIDGKKIALPGSPLKELQILGLLESRNLSFDNVFIAGMSDSALPAVQKESPLIPRDISFALGIEMAKKEYEIQKYHFDSLISSAKKAYFIYPDNEKDSRSRFIEKMIWDKQKESERLDCVKEKKLIIAHQMNTGEKKRKYAKTPEIKELLKNMTYSNSSIDAYLKCRLYFYFQYVLSLDEISEIGSDISGKDIGKCLHEFFQKTFRANFLKKDMNESFFEKTKIEFEKHLDKGIALRSGEDFFLTKKILIDRMEKFLENEMKRDFISVHKCEETYNSSIDTSAGNFALKCIIDRIDKTDWGYTIFDYKTGNVKAPLKPINFSKLLKSGEKPQRKQIKKSVNSLQLALYKYIFEKEENLKADSLKLYSIKDCQIIDFLEKFDDKDKVFEICIDMIKNILEEINSDGYFEFDENDCGSCENCKFSYICR
jgi:hypothetical protein